VVNHSVHVRVIRRNTALINVLITEEVPGPHTASDPVPLHQFSYGPSQDTESRRISVFMPYMGRHCEDQMPHRFELAHFRQPTGNTASVCVGIVLAAIRAPIPTTLNPFYDLIAVRALPQDSKPSFLPAARPCDSEFFNGCCIVRYAKCRGFGFPFKIRAASGHGGTDLDVIIRRSGPGELAGGR
jgi:hypothetical protein